MLTSIICIRLLVKYPCPTPPTPYPLIPTPFIKGVRVFKIFTKRRGSAFPVLSLWVFRVQVCVLFIYTISISIVCVSQEKLNLIESNQHIYGFFKWAIFKKQRHLERFVFDISELFIHCNTHNFCEYITGGVDTYLHGCVSLLTPECALWLYLCFCVISNQSTSKKHMCQTSINLVPCCIKHTRSIWY